MYFLGSFDPMDVSGMFAVFFRKFRGWVGRQKIRLKKQFSIFSEASTESLSFVFSELRELASIYRYCKSWEYESQTLNGSFSTSEDYFLVSGSTLRIPVTYQLVCSSEQHYHGPSALPTGLIRHA